MFLITASSRPEKNLAPSFIIDENPGALGTCKAILISVTILLVNFKFFRALLSIKFLTGVEKYFSEMHVFLAVYGFTGLQQCFVMHMCLRIFQKSLFQFEVLPERSRILDNNSLTLME